MQPLGDTEGKGHELHTASVPFHTLGEGGILMVDGMPDPEFVWPGAHPGYVDDRVLPPGRMPTGTDPLKGR
ncbi:hypothetical protein GCM10009546_03890 [Actinomadura livida]|uniref:Uncharacterized protein n=2 Tax=Actinomadura livida TaxID=79909 RepID=A0ABN1DJ96_9ACTN|nr:hypothetical protein GCM10010208_30130 [Actinomadura livida]